MADLITLTRAKTNLPSITDTSQDATLAILISAASKAIQRYCGRDFSETDYDELYRGSRDVCLLLQQYPIIGVASVRVGPSTVLKVRNSDSANQQARVAVTATELTLTRVASGTPAADSVTFSGNDTLTALASAVAGLGNGWDAEVAAGLDQWPSADLGLIQGALSAAGAWAELRMHVDEVPDFQIDGPRGQLIRAAGWPRGLDRYRVQYTAGFTDIPEDVQEACAELVAGLFKELDRNKFKHQESTAGYTYTTGDASQWPRSIRLLLGLYRNIRIRNLQG